MSTYSTFVECDNCGNKRAIESGRTYMDMRYINRREALLRTCDACGWKQDVEAETDAILRSVFTELAENGMEPVLAAIEAHRRVLPV
jgi:RNase P subunit RPR2